jgi:anhydro-N-acetylmuramic acid kinase
LVAHITEGRETCDRDGRIARGAKVHRGLLDSMIHDPYLARLGPKTAGREQFGQQFVSGLIATGVALPDLIATATEFTVHAAVYQIYRTIEPDEIIVSGGGIHNRWMMRRLREECSSAPVLSSAEFGVDPDAKEALAFAVLAYQSWQHEPANLPSATGARRPVVLGKRSY